MFSKLFQSPGCLMIDWIMVFNTVFIIISVISWRPLYLSKLFRSFFYSVPCTFFSPSHWLLSHAIIVETVGEQRWKPASKNIIYPFEEIAGLGINTLPDDKILDQTKLKAFADDKLNVTKMIISVFESVENIVGKGEIACTRNFFFSHNVFKGFFRRRLKRCHCVGMGKTIHPLSKVEYQLT